MAALTAVCVAIIVWTPVGAPVFVCRCLFVATGGALCDRWRSLLRHAHLFPCHAVARLGVSD